MIIRLLLLIAFVAVILIVRKQYQSTPKQDRKRLLWKYGLSAGAIILILLALTGRIHWLGAVIAALVPLVRQMLPMLLRLRQQKAQAEPNWQQQNETSTAILRMRYDPDSQQLSGEVLSGPFAGQSLSQLSQQQLQLLLDYCQASDATSAQLLISYLNHRFGAQWQQNSGNSNSANMSAEEAYALLGLNADADRDAIIQAHRRLMQKVHPDRGGNDYLAAKINQAKDLLLQRHSQ